MSTTTDSYFVLREGATTEEQWTWEEIRERCSSGEFSADTRVFLPDDNRWARIDETELRDALAEAAGEPEGSGEWDDARAELEHEYEDVVARLDDNSVEARIDAGCIASDLGLMDESRKHFQAVLDLQPFHARAAKEIRHRFPRAQHRAFRLLERPDPAWEDLADVIVFPVQRGWLYPLAPAALLSLLMFVPYGAMAFIPLALLWCYRAMLGVESGRREPPAWRRTIDEPMANIVVPAAVFLGVLGEGLLAFWMLARGAMFIEGKTYLGTIEYLGGSPLFLVALTLCALCYLPAVMIVLAPTPRAIVRALNPWSIVQAAMRMRSEYAMSLLLLISLAVALGVLGVATQWLHVVSKVVWACAVVAATMMASFILGRERARMSYLFDDR